MSDDKQPTYGDMIGQPTSPATQRPPQGFEQQVLAKLETIKLAAVILAGVAVLGLIGAVLAYTTSLG